MTGKSYATASEEIDARIAALGDWRGEMLARLRALIREADPGMTETVNWRKPTNPAGVPVWEHGGILCTGEVYKDKVKLTFPKGAVLDDPAGLFNASLEGNARRAIDFREGDVMDGEAFKILVQGGVGCASLRIGGCGVCRARMIFEGSFWRNSTGPSGKGDRISK